MLPWNLLQFRCVLPRDNTSEHFKCHSKCTFCLSSSVIHSSISNKDMELNASIPRWFLHDSVLPLLSRSLYVCVFCLHAINSHSERQNDFMPHVDYGKTLFMELHERHLMEKCTCLIALNDKVELQKRTHWWAVDFSMTCVFWTCSWI